MGAQSARYAATLLAASLVVLTGLSEASAIPEQAKSEGSMRVSLVTMVPGDALFTGFGHIALRFTDEGSGMDQVYDYGTYDAQDPAIVVNFLTGKLQYYCSSTTWQEMLDWYSEDFGAIEVRELRLAPQQVRWLLARVTHDCLPENAAYAYHHFYNNCSTKIRDILDELLAGRLREQLLGSPAVRSLRDLIDASMHRPQFAPSRWIVYGLLNGTIDSTADRWDQSFLPYYLTRELELLPLSEEGGPLASAAVLASGVPQGEPPDPSPVPGMIFLVALFLLSAVPLVAQRLGHPLLARRYAGTWLPLFSVLSGLYGILLVFSWAVSPYPETKSNWTVVALHPLHLVLTVSALGLWLKARWPEVVTRWYLLFWIAVSLLLLLANVTGMVQQRVWHYSLAGIVFALPPFLWLALKDGRVRFAWWPLGGPERR